MFTAGDLLMALLENGIRPVTGIAVGIGVLLLAPVVLPVIGSILKPIIKGGIKTGLILVEKGRQLAAEAQETLEDLVAEAKAEAYEDTKAKAVPVEPEPGTKGDAH
jgi:hypothetical protein